MMEIWILGADEWWYGRRRGGEGRDSGGGDRGSMIEGVEIITSSHLRQTTWGLLLLGRLLWAADAACNGALCVCVCV